MADYSGHMPRVSDRDAILALARGHAFGGDEEARQLLEDYERQGVDQPSLFASPGSDDDDQGEQGEDPDGTGDGESGDQLDGTPASRKAAKAAAAAQHRR